VFTAVIVTDAPPKVVSEREAKAMAQGEPAPAPQAAAAAPAPAPAPAAAPAPAPAHAKKLPKTASQVPLVGFAGAMTLLSALALTISRRLRRSS
jgi:LPXTG-motif cell wall-anchored protein